VKTKMLLLILACLLLGGCRKKIYTSFETNVVDSPDLQQTLIIDDGSDDGYRSFKDIDARLTTGLMILMGSNGRLVQRIETEYVDWYLISATVYFVETTEEDDIGMTMIMSDEKYYRTKHNDVTQQFEEFMNANEKEIIEINKVILEGHLVRVEIYYTE